jgi:hypothetical protein
MLHHSPFYKNRVVLLFSVLLISISVSAQSTFDEKKSDSLLKQKFGWKTFDEKEFSIQAPHTFERPKKQASFIIFAPLESPEDKFKENVNLLIQDLSGKNIDLDKFTEITIEQVQNYIKNAEITENKRLKNDNGEYQKFIYSGEVGAFSLKFEQYCWIVNEKAYILTFTAEKEKFDNNYQEFVEVVLNSFVLKVK